MRKVVLISLVIGLASPILLNYLLIGGITIWRFFVPYNPWTSSDCSNVDRGSIASPDGMREARVVYFSCGSPLSGYLRDYAVVAVLKAGQNPSSSAVAMEVDEGNGQEWRLTQSDVIWQSSSQLQVTLPKSVKIRDRKSRVDAVTIEVRRIIDGEAGSTGGPRRD